MEVRRATTSDLDAVLDLADMVDPPSHGMDVDRDYYASIIEHGRLVVAEASEIVVGYCGVIPVATALHVSDLFLHPDAHGRGIGRDLLAAVWHPDVDAPRQTFSSRHPAALPLYIRAGMQPRWPLLYLEGDAGALPRGHFTTRDVTSQEAADVEESWLGWNRLDQYRYWSSRSGARTFAVLDAETPVAVGCLARSRMRFTLLHLSVVDPSVQVEALSAVGTVTTGDVLVAAPGPSAATPALVNAGWRIVDQDIYCSSDAGLTDATRLLPHPGFV